MNVSSVRLTVPKAASGELVRIGLVDRVNQGRFAYIHAGAGYGKTTLLSQIARSSENAVWFSSAGESDVCTFANTICEAVRQTFPQYSFAVSEYLPFIENENFTTILANALIASMENLSQNILLILDDIHTIKNLEIKELITSVIRFAPESIRICLGSREAPFAQLALLRAVGKVLVIGQKELTFSQEESAQVLGFDDAEIFGISEGWPLAVGSFRVLLENGASPEDIPLQGREALYSYLFQECIRQLPCEMIEFLKDSACFDELDVPMLDAVLKRKNARLILESLVARNLFTIKTGGGQYRYHALFKKCLLDAENDPRERPLWQKAAEYYFEQKNYPKAVEYTILLDDQALLQKIILASYKDLIRTGSFSELRLWFQSLGDSISPENPEIFVAKGAYLSCIGNFTEAQKYLDAAIPLLNGENRELYLNAMVHKARVLRNFTAFEASNAVLDELLSELESFASETAYAVVVEKLYNLCWNSQVGEAFALADRCIEQCARAGNLKIKAWYERYLTAVYFFSGNMKQTVYYYEKSLALTQDEREYLDIHDIDVYAAKAYQMMGDRTRAHSILTGALQQMRSRGKYEEMWSGYLFAAEIHFQNAVIDRTNGENATFDTTIKYFTLADEYSPLYRKTDFQRQWAKMQRLTYSLMFTNSPKKEIIQEINANLGSCSIYLKSVILARLMGFFAAVHDLPNTAGCAKQCVEIGENAGMLLHSTLAYGILARAAIAAGNREEAVFYTQRSLRLCADNGIYEYFMARKEYDPILHFASENGIELEAAKQIMEFCGYKIKKAYIKTFGGFSVFPYNDRVNPLKMRTKKERELLAFLIDAGEQGVTKEQICEAIWPESESENIKKLIGVNLTQIKKDLSGLGIENAIVCTEKRYRVCMDEIECDFALFKTCAGNNASTVNLGESRKLLSLYTGEYLSDFEAFWAISKRIQYREMYDAVVAANGFTN